MSRSTKFVKAALIGTLSLSLGIASAAGTEADSYPNKAIRIINPFAAGGGVDASIRVFSKYVSESLGQPIIVESKRGAGGAIAGQYVATAAPDGYTLLITNDGPNATLPAMQSLSYDAYSAFTPVTNLYHSPLVLSVPASLNVSSVAELVQLAKTKKGGLSYGTQGVGTTGHIAGLLLSEATKAPLTPVPYGGGAPMYLDLISGRVDIAFGTYSAIEPHVKDGKLKVLATISPTRWEGLPDVPTMAEAGVSGIEMRAWWGLAAPAGTPPAVIAKLNKAFIEAGANPELRKHFENTRLQVSTSTPEETDKFMKSEAVYFADVIKKLGIAGK